MNRNLRAAMSFALAFLFAGTVTLNSFAASDLNETNTYGNSEMRLGISMLSEPTGRLAGTGHFTIDGDEAQSGATVLSGSRIATGQDGDVTIDLGSLGQIALRSDTTIKLTFSKNRVEVSLDRAGSIIQLLPAGVRGQMTVQSGNIHLGISRGEVEVKSVGNVRTLHAGEVMAVAQMTEVITTGETLLTAEGGGRSANGENMATADYEATSGNTQGATPPARGNFISAGLIGIIALAGTATAITLGVISGRNRNSNSIAPRPSQVVP